MPYIPRGYIRASDALLRIIEASGTPPVTQHEALSRLREALAEGDLTASLLSLNTGALWKVTGPKSWRSDDGLRALQSGRLWYTNEYGAEQDDGLVLIEAAAIEAWLNPPAATADSLATAAEGLPAAQGEAEAPAAKAMPPPAIVAPGARAKPPRAAHSTKSSRAVSREVAAAISDLGAKLAAEGVPVRGDGVQASLERWFIATVEERGGTTSEGRARVHVRKAIEAHRAALAR